MKKARQLKLQAANLAPPDIVAVTQGHFGWHATVGGKLGLWSTDKESPEKAAAKCIAKHVLQPLIEDALKKKLRLFIEVKEFHAGTWSVHTRMEP